VEIKALHCSDLHMDTVYPHISASGDKRRQEQRNVYLRILRLAIDENVDMVLIAGDLFDQARVSPRTISFIKEGISSIAPIPVFIAPGNADPYIPESPYACTVWPANTVIFTSNRFKIHEIPEKNLILYGAANKSTEDDHGVLKNFVTRPKEGIHVLIFHGTHLAYAPAGVYACLPFCQRDLEKVRARYLALGHLHRQVTLEGLPAGLTAAYPGAADHLDYSDTTDKGVLLVTLSEEETHLRIMPTGKSGFHLEHLDCSNIKNESDLAEMIKEISGEKGVLGQCARFVLEGESFPGFRVESLQQKLEGHFLAVSIVDMTASLNPLPFPPGDATILSHFQEKHQNLVKQEKGEYRSSLRKAFNTVLDARAPEKEGGF